ncbi:MAG: exporters of the superfamily [Deltaproteobacteria bacterium]|nr:exporters of the superfamily [Deltaproteobacteria bacterium]
MSRSPDIRARRYVAWIRRRSLAIILTHLALLGGAIYLIGYRLPLFADFSHLLPQDAPAVRDLRRLEARVKATDIVLAVIDAPSSEVRAAAVRELADRMSRISPDLIEHVDADDGDVREFLKARRHLYVPLDDLVRARDALTHRIHDAKLRANPLYIDLEDHDPAAEARAKQELEDLRTKRREAEAKLDHPSNVSTDGRIAMIQIHAPFRATDAGRGELLLAALDGVRTEVMAAHPGVKIGFTGSIVMAVAEHNAIFKGMVLSSVITMLLVALVLALYFRSATLLVLLIGTLAIATTVSFGFAAITVGHLNAATAFLGAIIAGNGVNYGILLIARYLEERRRHDTDHAIAAAIVGTLRPTAVASLGASIAYGSLAATSFKGFADFAVIGAIGMMVCWIATYLLLPALMLRWGRNTRIYRGDPLVGSTLVRLIGFRRSGVVCSIAVAAAAIATVIVVRYVAADPFEYDIKQLRSEGADAVTARSWMGVSDHHFGRGYSGRTYIAADRIEQVPLIVTALHQHDASLRPEDQTFGSVSSVLDVVPEHQREKLAVLSQIRDILDDDALAALDDKERAELLELRPPNGLAVITNDSLPSMIKDRLAEKDGRIGFLISIRPANHLDEWNGRDLIRFADAVRKVQLGDGETITTSGSSVIFADIVGAIERDGPRVTGVAALGLVIMVLLLVGPNRRSIAVLIGTAAGSLLMVAICAVLGLRVNFLDFVALPITLGLGIDYAINVAHRHDEEAIPDPLTTLRTSGSAVFVCSLTTIIGYGSLLVSDNLAIRGFGQASLIGEIACVFTALVLVPAILATRRRRPLPSARAREAA